jgi:Bacterial Ig-like domain (group 1)
MCFVKILSSWLLVILIAACGGGGGSAGSTGENSGANTNSSSGSVTPSSTITGGTQVVASGSMSIDVLGGAGTSSTSISVLEIAQAKVTLKDSKGNPVKGAVVTFAESVASLLTVAPASKTALTDDAGQASVEIRAVSSTAIGATIIGASASLSGEQVSAQKAIQISSAPSTGPVISPQDLATAINFLDVNPADKSIVIQGAGGNGRSESATLRFRVVDKNNTPVKGAVVIFVANPATNVTLNIASAITDAEGIVITTVSSKTVATSTVIKASVSGKTISSQSDQLLVTTGVGIQQGFEIGAEKYNLDGGLSGDSTNVTARIVDANGNPVADGVPVVFTTSGGRIGTSARGGCTTLNGKCSVVFEVQDPRNDDLALVTASTQVGATLTLAGAFNINMSDPSLFFVDSTLTPVSTINLSACKQTYTGLVKNARGRAAAAGTSVAARAITTDFTAAVKLGSPIADSVSAGFPPLPVSMEFDAATIKAPFNCIPGGFAFFTAQASVEMTTPASKIKSAQVIDVTYPGGSVFLADPIRKTLKTEVSLGSCAAETVTFTVLTDVPGVSPPLGMTVEATSDQTSAVTKVISGSPLASSPFNIVTNIQAPSGGAEACSLGGRTLTSFPMYLVIRLNPGLPNEITQIQTVNVKYGKAP